MARAEATRSKEGGVSRASVRSCGLQRSDHGMRRREVAVAPAAFLRPAAARSSPRRGLGFAKRSEDASVILVRPDRG